MDFVLTMTGKLVCDAWYILTGRGRIQVTLEELHKLMCRYCLRCTRVEGLL